MAETLIFEPDGRAIPYIDEDKAGPALVLIPGRGLKIDYLGILSETLAEEDFRVVRIGPRRASADSPVSMHDLAQDVVDVMEHVGLGNAWVGGHGFGGSVARTIALDHHDRIDGVLLLGVENSAGEEGSDASEVPAQARNPEAEAMQSAAQKATPEAEWTTVAPALPVLVVQGTEDRLTPPENGDELRASAPDRVSVVRVEGGGHLFPITHIGETSWAIEDYLDWD